LKYCQKTTEKKALERRAQDYLKCPGARIFILHIDLLTRVSGTNLNLKKDQQRGCVHDFTSKDNWLRGYKNVMYTRSVVTLHRKHLSIFTGQTTETSNRIRQDTEVLQSAIYFRL
jgi:hypothetical protein